MAERGELSDLPCTWHASGMHLACTEAHDARGTVDRGGNGGVGSAPSQATTKIYTHWLSQRESFTAFLGKTDN